MKKIIIYTDGGARGNPGAAAAGYVIMGGGKILAEEGVYLGDNLTNNYAEYEALFLALTRAHEMDLAQHAVEARLDSKLVVEQVSNRWKVKEPSLKSMCAKVQQLIKNSFASVTCVHIPREKNSAADALVNKALDAQ